MTWLLSEGILATRGKSDKDSMTRIDARGVFIEKGKKIHKISFQDEKPNTPVAEVKEVAQAQRVISLLLALPSPNLTFCSNSVLFLRLSPSFPALFTSRWMFVVIPSGFGMAWKTESLLTLVEAPSLRAHWWCRRGEIRGAFGVPSIFFLCPGAWLHAIQVVDSVILRYHVLSDLWRGGVGCGALSVSDFSTTLCFYSQLLLRSNACRFRTRAELSHLPQEFTSLRDAISVHYEGLSITPRRQGLSSRSLGRFQELSPGKCSFLDTHRKLPLWLGFFEISENSVKKQSCTASLGS